VAGDVIAAGEGIETMLSLRSALPSLPIVAALSANHLAALLFPVKLRRLYVACDDDPTGHLAIAKAQLLQGARFSDSGFTKDEPSRGRAHHAPE
jgi:hypothetical protein